MEVVVEKGEVLVFSSPELLVHNLIIDEIFFWEIRSLGLRNIFSILANHFQTADFQD